MPKENDRSLWMYERKWGVFIHLLGANLPEEEVSDDPTQLTAWEKRLEAFDVDHFAAQLNEIGAGWCGVTICQLYRWMIAPNETFDRITGYKPGEACSRIDFIDRLIKALDKYDIGLMLYFTGDGLSRDPKAKAAFDTWDDEKRVITKEFVEKWAEVAREYSLRYGKKVKAWWQDGMWVGDYKNRHELLKIYADAFRAGNPDAAIATNIESCIDQDNAELVLSPRRGAKYDDYTAGEVVTLGKLPYHPYMDGCGARWHILTFLAQTPCEVEGWGGKGCKYKPGWLFDYMDEVHKRGGIITFDIRYEPDGTIDEDQMRALRLLKHL